MKKAGRSVLLLLWMLLLVLLVAFLVLKAHRRFRNEPFGDASVMDTIPILVINLERRPDRKRAMQERLGNHPNVTFLKAIDMRDPNAPLMPVEPGKNFKMGERACYASHVMAWKWVQSHPSSPAIILEDDAVLEWPRMKEQIRSFVQAWSPVRAKPILGILGLNNMHETTLITHRPHGATLGRLTSTLMGAQAYMIDSDAASILLKLGGSVMTDALDIFLGSDTVKEHLDVLVIYPALVKVMNVYDSETNVNDISTTNSPKQQ